MKRDETKRNETARKERAMALDKLKFVKIGRAHV